MMKAFWIAITLSVLGAIQAECKTTELIFDQVIQKDVVFDNDVPEWKQESPDQKIKFSSYFKQFTLENIGTSPISHCFPSANQTLPLSLKNLSQWIASKEDKVTALMTLWHHRVMIDPNLPDDRDVYPLDLLNYKGVCSPNTYQIQFINLCHLLEIEVRQSRVAGGAYFDFCAEDSWTLLNPLTGQFYLDFNNDTKVSSERIMDDPLLLLRGIKEHYMTEIDFTHAWMNLAHFDILYPQRAEIIPLKKIRHEERSDGFTIYPQEQVIFKTATSDPSIPASSILITQTLNLPNRKTAIHFEERFPFPVREVINHTDRPMQISCINGWLQPGHSLTFPQDTFLVEGTFDAPPSGTLTISGMGSWSLFTPYVKGENVFSLQTTHNSSIIRWTYVSDDEASLNKCPLVSEHKEYLFDHAAPSFALHSMNESCEQVWWQIASDEAFTSVPSVLDQVQELSTPITLSTLAETFINPETTYYFRCKSFQNGTWSDWSVTYPFSVKKPHAVEEVSFEEISEDHYRLDWRRRSEESVDPIEYLVFGSNCIDFIPSVYTALQINSICDGRVIETEPNDNLVAITNDTHLDVSGHFAYYRIIAKRNGQLSVPSSLIRVYANTLIQPRSVLQDEPCEGHTIAKRILFPSSYDRAVALPLRTTHAVKFSSFSSLPYVIKSTQETSGHISDYQFPDVSQEIWDEIGSNLLPPNHPAWPKLNRIFCEARVTETPEHFRKAGFKQWTTGYWSRVIASTHPKFPEYFLKVYCDNELGIIYDWKKWLNRIRGAETIRECIKEYHLEKHFKVPKKWIYPLPQHPSPQNSNYYIRKNFLLVCENMRIYDHEASEKLYKTKMTKKMAYGLYTILQICGLCDSVHVINIPFSKDGKIAFIDTEFHHIWPIVYGKLNHVFSSEIRLYWEKITQNGGKIPSGIPEHRPPRMDRYDKR